MAGRAVSAATDGHPDAFRDIMNDEQRQFLSLMGQLPARLTVLQTAWVLNFQEHDIPVLVAAGLLKPLGNPAANGIKYFATVEVLALAKDPLWLGKATKAIRDHWRTKNSAHRLAV